MVTFHGLEPNEPNQQTEKKPAVQASPLPKPKQLNRVNGNSPFGLGPMTKFNWPWAKTFCLAIQTQYMMDVLKQPNMPSYSQITLWSDKYPKFKEWIERSRKMFADYLAERSTQLFEDDPVMEVMQTKNGSYSRISMSGVQRERYKSQAMQWYASKWNPDKYGDKLNVQNSLDLSIVLSTVNTKATPKALKQATKQVNQIIDAEIERKNDTTK